MKILQYQNRDLSIIIDIKMQLQFKHIWERNTFIELPLSHIYLRRRLVLVALQWLHNEHDSVSNHQPYDCLLNRLFRHKLMKTSKLRVTGLGEGNSPVTGELPTHRASNAENVYVWWRHHGVRWLLVTFIVFLESNWVIFLWLSGRCVLEACARSLPDMFRLMFCS